MKIRVARSQQDWQDVWRLTCSVYRQQCYVQSPPEDGCLRHYPHLDQITETTAIMAEEGGELVGTISVTEDGPYGLHVDETFPAKVEQVRCACDRSGKRLGASWRIVTRPESRMGFRVFRKLVTAAIGDMVRRGLDVTLYSFNPRHERAYQRLLGLETIARTEHDWSVCGAPAVLMLGRVEALRKRWRRR